MEFVLVLGALIMAVVAGLKRVYKIARNVEQLMTHASAGEAQLARAIEQQAKIERAVADIKKEVLPNGGSSLRDAVNRIETRVTVLEALDHQELIRRHGERVNG